jgi:DNA-binding HxlR family transcriptional regulator
MAKDYGQYCGLARALDVIGDRWTLLIVRQLLIAPSRYKVLRKGLPGVATNLLADRLRDLEEAGVVERRLGESGAVEYALTEWGTQLRGPIEGLIRWSSPLMVRGAQGDHFRGEWLLLALPALLAHRKPPSRTVSVGVAVAGETVTVHAAPSGITVARDDAAQDAVVSSEDPALVLGLAAGMLRLDDLETVVTVHGDRTAVEAVFEN